MGWRDDYRPGAFRGAPFHLKSSTASGGRRTVLNEFPLRDEPNTEDLGRRARQFSLVMTVIGQDYMTKRDRLIEALETKGPGNLMHPFRGELQVAVLGDYSCEESTEQGGLARISVTFVEAGETPRPDNHLAQGSLVNASADALQADAVAEFEEEWNLVDKASFVADGAIDMLQEATQAILGAGGLLEGGGQFGTLYRRLTSSFQQLILAPGNLAGQLLGLVKGMSATSNPWQSLRAQMSLFNLGSKAKAVSSTAAYQTPARRQMVANQAAVYRLIERAAVSEAARLAASKPAISAATGPAVGGTVTQPNTSGDGGGSGNGGSTVLRPPTNGSIGSGSNTMPSRLPGVSFDNRDQATEIRDQLLDELDRQQLAASPARYRPLAQLSADLVTELNGQAASLAPLTRVTPATTLPALVLAHRLYGDARQADDIVARNHISHPGFVQGGQELEVRKNA